VSESLDNNNLHPELLNELKPRERVYSNFALAILAIFLFFIFFGTKIPFGEKITEAENLGTSNVINQIVFGGLFVFSLVLLIPKRKELFSLIKREKFLTIFLFWSLITIIWSNYSLVSFKRYIQYLTTVTVSLSVLLHVKDTKRIINVFKIILGGYLLIALLTILTIPGAHDRFGIWRGVASHKNTLGQISLISVIFFTAIFKKEYSLKSKTIVAVLIIMAMVLLIGSQSSTSRFTFIILFVLSATLLIDKVFESIGIRKTVSLFTMFIFLVMFISIILVVPEIIEAAVGSTGKDLTFTGRVDLWADIWEEAQNHLLIGTGFQGYWVVTSTKVELLFEIYSWLPTQAHNGYLDIINEVGIIGIILFSFILINYFVNLTRAKQKQIWKWFIIAALIINITESAFIRPKVVVGVMFIFSYLALFSDIYHKKKLESEFESD